LKTSSSNIEKQCGMSNRNKGEKDGSGEAEGVPAGSFSIWLSGAEASLRSGKDGADVPCGACRGCCRSSMFIHIGPEETRTIRRIPRALLFPAPGLPKGHVLMGYDDQGCCPMLVEGECSIYEDRPQTCRDYDCRVFAATGVSVNCESQAEIANRVKAWAFTYEREESREEHRMVKAAAAFLERNRDLFPPGSLPGYPVQLAALAVRICRLFSDQATRMQEAGSAVSDAAMVKAILAARSEPETPAKFAILD
jgi:Fe-S-cluster containining protein